MSHLKESQLKEIFIAYAKYGKSPRQLTSEPMLEGKNLIKMMKQAKLINKQLPAVSMDLIFAHHKTKGKKQMNFDEFLNALADIAKRKKLSFDQVKEVVVLSGRPKSKGATKTQAVKFYDDKSLYTGTWANGKGGPDKFGKGNGVGKLNLSDMMDRSPANVRGVKKDMVDANGDKKKLFKQKKFKN